MKPYRTIAQRGLLLAGLLTLVCVLTACGAKPSALTPNQGDAYIIYVGLNDADTGKQVHTTDEAMQVIRASLEETKQGATVMPAWGSYVNDKGAFCGNDTMMVILNAPEDTIQKYIDQWKADLNLATIYLEKYAVEYQIFGGQV